jgi:hypothetical protein
MRKTNYLGKAIMLFSLSLFLMSSDCEPEDLEEEQEPVAENVEHMKDQQAISNRMFFVK